MSRPAGLVSVSHLAGAEIRYARQPVADYGTRGRPRNNSMLPGFRDQLEAAREDLWARCPLGEASVIVSAGAWVDKSGEHGRGRAIDIDAIWWPTGKPLITRDAQIDSGRYLGTSALLRLYFGTVIGWWCNAAHRDHWHLDDHDGVGFRPGSPSEVAFVQASCLYVHGISPGPIDRLWGPRTRAAVDEVLGGDWQVGADLAEPLCWREFLRETFRRGWACAEDPWG